jgi:hypothetical protein
VINLPFPGDMDPDPPLPPRTTPGNLCLHVPYPGHGAKKGQNKLAKKIEKEKKRKKKIKFQKYIYGGPGGAPRPSVSPLAHRTVHHSYLLDMVC